MREPDELAGQRRTLLALACDADLVLDLHCDSEALTHLYTATPLWPQVEPLARLIGAQATLLALQSGDHPFDEACSQTWWQLAEAFPQHPLPAGCVSVTVELRGERDVSHELAGPDAEALLAYLAHRGDIDAPPPPLPPLPNEATPLEATEVIATPAAGVVVYRRALGERVQPGDLLAEVIDPLSGEVHPLRSGTEGLLLTRDAQRLAPAGRPLLKVVGRVPVRSGKLSSD
ncbi:succinylglutamate desuccinylase/aspartoacylase family protein [Piscinibacter sakaiensis]